MKKLVQLLKAAIASLEGYGPKYIHAIEPLGNAQLIVATVSSEATTLTGTPPTPHATNAKATIEHGYYALAKPAEQQSSILKKRQTGRREDSFL